MLRKILFFFLLAVAFSAYALDPTCLRDGACPASYTQYECTTYGPGLIAQAAEWNRDVCGAFQCPNGSWVANLSDCPVPKCPDGTNAPNGDVNQCPVPPKCPDGSIPPVTGTGLISSDLFSCPDIPSCQNTAANEICTPSGTMCKGASIVVMDVPLCSGDSAAADSAANAAAQAAADASAASAASAAAAAASNAASAKSAADAAASTAAAAKSAADAAAAAAASDPSPANQAVATSTAATAAAAEDISKKATTDSNTAAASSSAASSKASAASSDANTKATKTNTDAAKGNTDATKGNTNAVTSNTGSLEAGTAATGSNTTATNNNTAASDALKGSVDGLKGSVDDLKDKMTASGNAAVGSGLGDQQGRFYTASGRSISSAIQTNVNALNNSPVFAFSRGMFNVTLPAVACPVWHIPTVTIITGYTIGGIDLNVLCSSTMTIIFIFIKSVVMVLAVFSAFRLATSG